MTKIFPKSRVCIIDINQPLHEGVAKAFAFAKKHNIQISTADGRRLVTGFCVENIYKTYKETSSIFPKATCLSKKTMSNRISYFVENYFEHILKQLPIFYCGLYDLTSPDLEMAAENTLKRQQTQKSFNCVLSKLKVRHIAQ